MKNKEKIERCLEELTEEAFKANKTTGVETLQISEKLNLRRNVVSHYLNVLVSENKVIKIKSRPVQFISKKILDKYRREKSYEIKEGSIDEVIYENITSLYNILIEYDENNLSIEEFRKKISLAINICLSNILYKEKTLTFGGSLFSLYYFRRLALYHNTINLSIVIRKIIKQFFSKNY